MYFRRKFNAVGLQCLGANTNLKLFLMNSERSECVVKDLTGFAVGIFSSGYHYIAYFIEKTYFHSH